MNLRKFMYFSSCIEVNHRLGVQIYSCRTSEDAFVLYTSKSKQIRGLVQAVSQDGRHIEALPAGDFIASNRLRSSHPAPMPLRGWWGRSREVADSGGVRGLRGPWRHTPSNLEGPDWWVPREAAPCLSCWPCPAIEARGPGVASPDRGVSASGLPLPQGPFSGGIGLRAPMGISTCLFLERWSARAPEPRLSGSAGAPPLMTCGPVWRRASSRVAPLVRVLRLWAGAGGLCDRAGLRGDRHWAGFGAMHLPSFSPIYRYDMDDLRERTSTWSFCLWVALPFK
ncbi:hypothetical protein NDU88_005891 [Pleurodeles waltl]|uniref:Uncharacterized protein n=1 Tax=Pleurodeles waltl TaxID=8319 RepID=A0AAV7PJB4_PLEWA|nr:hypothetical protein NDU88_005891 [Pleurodeles waltl]